MQKIIECPLCAERLDEDLSCERCGFDYTKRWYGDEHFLNFHYQSDLEFGDDSTSGTYGEEDLETLYKSL